VQLHRDEPLLQASGLALHVIGNGAPSFIAGFRETTGFTGPLYTDPSLAVFRAAELKSGLATIFSLGAITRTIGALRRGFRQGRTQGSALQQGGVLVIAPDGEVRWHHISSGPGDNATAAEIVAAVA
jgi:uncharacterized membrane protein YedE/YeeE